MDINPDFRTRLRERSSAKAERFEFLRAGGDWMSIQLPEVWPLDLWPTRGIEDCDGWTVAIYAANGTAATPSTHQRIFQDRLWRRYWIDSPQAPSIPRKSCRRYDFLVLGPERYEEMTTML